MGLGILGLGGGMGILGLYGMSHTLLGCGFGVVSVTMTSAHTVLLWPWMGGMDEGTPGGRRRKPSGCWGQPGREGGGETLQFLQALRCQLGVQVSFGCLGLNWEFRGWDCFGVEVSQGFSSPMRDPAEPAGGSAPVGQEGRTKGFIDNKSAPETYFLLGAPK